MLIFALFHIGGVANLDCQIQGEPKPLLEWILPDGSKVRAPYSSDDRRIVIYAEGKLTLRSADMSDAGMYRCIATNFLDADILVFRVTVLSPDVEEVEVNGVQLSRSLGENQVLDCSSSGSPKGSVQWMLPDQSVVDMSHGNKKLYENGTLEIQGLTARDRGFYRCIAANHLGVDLLVSQLTLTEEKTGLDSEGSGMTDISSAENAITIDETRSSSPYNRSNAESQRIPPDPTDSIPRLQGRGGAGRTRGQRRGPLINRHPWSRRVFDKASRTVEQKKFAEFMKKAQKGSGVKSGTLSNTDDDNETGSAVDFNEDHLIIAADGLLGVANPAKKQQTITTTETENKNTTTEMYTQPESRPVTSVFRNTDELHSSQETQIQFTAQPAEPETSTWGAVSLNTDPYITPMSDSAGSRDVVVHAATDSERQTLLATITTTESQQDEITFHTTQTLKSPHLLAGSTIISQQKIHIIPHKNSRSQGHRKIFHSRRRIIKPSRITNVQSLLNQLKQSSNKKNTETTEAPTSKTTEKSPQKPTFSAITSDIISNDNHPQKESRPEVSDGHIATAYTAVSAVSEPTPGQFLNKHKQESIRSTTVMTSTTASKIIRGKIPWTRLFGSKNKDQILGRLKKPFIRQKLTTTTTSGTKTPSISTLPTHVFATATIPSSPMDRKDIQPPLRNTERREGSSDDYEGFSSSDSESTTQTPSIYQVSAATPSVHRSFTTAETPSGLQIFPSPPTVKPPSAENKVILSGSGGFPDILPIIRQRPGWKGQKRKIFRGRRPLNRPATELHPRKSTTPSTTGIKMEITTPQHWAYSSPSPSYKPSNKPTDVQLFQETYWNRSNSDLAYTTTKRRLISSTKLNRTTMLRPIIPQNKVDNTKPSTWSKNARAHRTYVTGIKPTVMSNSSGESSERSLGTTTVIALQEKYTSTPSTYNIIDAYSNFYDRTNGIEGTSSSIQDPGETSKLMTYKPKITGGNAASYTVLSHSNAYLPCEAVGNPQPTINWRRLASGTGRYGINWMFLAVVSGKNSLYISISISPRKHYYDKGEDGKIRGVA